jgi:uroporphyrinogen-III decarboxylase
MNSRERLLRCMRHQPIDRVPISTYELVGWNETAWENQEPSYRKLMDTIRLYTDCIYMLNPKEKKNPNPAQETIKWEVGESRYTKTLLHTNKGVLTSVQRKDWNIHTTWNLEHLLKDISDIDTYLSIPYEPPQFDMNAFHAEEANLGDKGVMMISIPDPICIAAELFEMSEFLVLAMTEPEKIKYFLDALHERQIHELRSMLKYNVKDVLFRICGPEYATPPYLSPEYFYNYVTCYLIPICREIKAAGGISRIHCHGKVRKVIDQFAMTEAEGIDPVEPPPDGDIELSELKRLYGRRFCLFGNLELKELEISDRTRIDQLVKKAMEDAKEGSGFVLMPTAAPINVPLSCKAEGNYLQMIESALRYGVY